ncbi:MAG: zinc ribbon domain-containing protein [Bacillota bacterium]
MADKYNLNNHKQTRKILRVLGPVVLIIGILLIISGVSSLFAMGSQSQSSYFVGEPEPRNNFSLPFIGIPLLFVGSVMSMYGYMGKVARYQASELAPVGKDVANYMMDNTKDSVRGFAGAIGEGLNQSSQTSSVQSRCSVCGNGLDEDSQFCDQCGTQTVKVCTKCGTDNESDAKFCDACGSQF